MEAFFIVYFVSMVIMLAMTVRSLLRMPVRLSEVAALLFACFVPLLNTMIAGLLLSFFLGELSNWIRER